MHLARSLTGISLFVAVAAAACGGGTTARSTSYGSPTTTTTTAPAASGQPSAPASPAAPAAPAPGQASIGLGKTALGAFLVDGTGRTVYLFEADMGTTSNCYDRCAKFWPPVTSMGTAVATNGVLASLIGSTARTDGTTQVLYKGHPLYYFTSDKASGDTKGQGLNAFGGGWYVVAAAGDKMDKG